MNIDFSTARTKHLTWKVRLRNYLMGEGGEPLDHAQAVSPKHCDLGRWLYSEGLEKYGNLPDMQKLEALHAAMHASVGRVIASKDEGDLDAAQAELINVSYLSEELVKVMDALE